MIPLFFKEGLGEILWNCHDWKIPLNPPLQKGEEKTRCTALIAMTKYMNFAKLSLRVVLFFQLPL
jgi:hypothetical protein